MKPKIYTDTSVIGGCLDKEFEIGSNALLENFKSGVALLMISNLTLLELKFAPKSVQDILKQVPLENIFYVALSNESKQLADAYLAADVVPQKSKIDAQHIAIASVNRADVLVSWNFKHIVNLDRIHAYNSVNLKQGYPMIEIRTPLEVLDYGD